MKTEGLALKHNALYYGNGPAAFVVRPEIESIAGCTLVPDKHELKPI